MRRLTLTLPLLLLVPVITASAAGAEEELRCSGTIVEVRPNNTMVVEEMQSWQGPAEPGIVRHLVAVRPRTSIRVVERTDDWGPALTSRPGWESTDFTPSALKRGEFVTVTVHHDTPRVAVAMEIVEPAGR